MIDTFSTMTGIKTAVVTGRHPYDLPAFQAVFRSIAEIDFYPQHLEDFVADEGKIRSRYDVVVFYNFHQETPTTGKEWENNATREALEKLGENTQGILILHHALLAWKQWQLWTDITGVKDRSFGYYHDQSLHVHVADSNHPITQGMSDWDMVDETYTMSDARPEDGNRILLTVDHPLSMKTLAWTRQYRRSRVFCWESGHDAETFVNPNFRLIMSRAIQWLAGRI
jgi:uncharacterized protein